MVELTLVVAVASDGAIGRANALPWNIPEDLRLFKEYTSGGVVVMGHNTYKSLPARFRPLPDRTNIVITRDPASASCSDVGVIYCDMTGVGDAISGTGNPRVYVIGGSSIYSAFMDCVHRIRITRICKAFPDCDAYFPSIPARFVLTNTSEKKYCAREDCEFYIEEYTALVVQ